MTRAALLLPLLASSCAAPAPGAVQAEVVHRRSEGATDAERDRLSRRALAWVARWEADWGRLGPVRIEVWHVPALVLVHDGKGVEVSERTNGRTVLVTADGIDRLPHGLAHVAGLDRRHKDPRWREVEQWIKRRASR